MLREGLVDLLRAAGHSVEAVADGESALQRGSDPVIQLVLLDLMLPKLDGMEVCRRLREIRPDLPILVLTALGSEDDKVTGQGIETTIRDHVLKGDFELAESTLTFTTRGIIKNSDTIQKVLEMLNTIAGQIEAAPILCP